MALDASFIETEAAKVVADTGTESAELVFGQPDLRHVLFNAAYRGSKDEFCSAVRALVTAGANPRQIFSSVGTCGNTLWRAACNGRSTEAGLFVLNQLGDDCTFHETAATLIHAFGTRNIYNMLRDAFFKHIKKDEEEEDEGTSPYAAFECKYDLFSFPGIRTLLKGVPDSFIANLAACTCIVGNTTELVSIEGLRYLLRYEVDLNTGLFNTFFPLFFEIGRAHV